MPEELNRFLRELIAICKLLGDANMESDDTGDRWLEFRRVGVRNSLWGQIRARYINDSPVWEIVIGYGVTTSITEYVERV